MPAKYRKTVSKTLGSSSKDVFERRMSTESGPLTFWSVILPKLSAKLSLQE